MADEKTNTVSEEVTTTDGAATTVDTTTQTKTTEISCGTLIDDRSLFWRILQAAIAALVLSLGTGWFIGWWAGAELDPQAWSVFLNAKLPLIWTQTTTTLLTVYLVDLITPGRTIATILYLEGPCDTWQNRAVAAFFLIGLAAVVGYTVKGGF